MTAYTVICPPITYIMAAEEAGSRSYYRSNQEENSALGDTPRNWNDDEKERFALRGVLGLE